MRLQGCILKTGEIEEIEDDFLVDKTLLCASAQGPCRIWNDNLSEGEPGAETGGFMLFFAL